MEQRLPVRGDGRQVSRLDTRCSTSLPHRVAIPGDNIASDSAKLFEPAAALSTTLLDRIPQRSIESGAARPSKIRGHPRPSTANQ
jgi:hypothetical protein